MNKKLEDQQLFLLGNWYKKVKKEVITQKIYTLFENLATSQSKKIQKRYLDHLREIKIMVSLRCIFLIWPIKIR